MRQGESLGGDSVYCQAQGTRATPHGTHSGKTKAPWENKREEE